MRSIAILIVASAGIVPTWASATPSGSSFPSIQPSQIPSNAPSGSSLPSLYPSGEPSSIPSDQPSLFPSSHPSLLPSSEPSPLPSSEPSNATPSFTVHPSLLPSQNSSVGGPTSLQPVSIPLPTFFVQTPTDVATSVTVAIPSRSQMDDTTTKAFETATVDFLTMYMPTGSGATVISVVVTKQTVFAADNRMLRRRQLEEGSELEVAMQVEGTQAPGTEDDVSFSDVIKKTFADNPEAFKDKLGSVSSFFRAEFAYAESQGSNGVITSESRTSDEGGGNASNVGVIVGSIIGVLAAAIIAVILFMKLHRNSEEDDVNEEEVNEDDGNERHIELLSWSTTTPVSAHAKGYDFNEDDPDMNSPTESEVYNDDDRFNGSGTGKLSPIAENRQVRLEECTVNTPQNSHTVSQATPRGTKFVQMDFNGSQVTRKAANAQTSNNILGDLEDMEDEWEGQLVCKVDAVSETPKQNNLQKFKVGGRSTYAQ